MRVGVRVLNFRKIILSNTNKWWNNY